MQLLLRSPVLLVVTKLELPSRGRASKHHNPAMGSRNPSSITTRTLVQAQTPKRPGTFLSPMRCWSMLVPSVTRKPRPTLSLSLLSLSSKWAGRTSRAELSRREHSVP
ncbi:hypothetical protein BZA05DRAFT_398774 [Tricharina praecox]|uniref:uncharacterized protein n=1 Tax=Tricharina praecox TaxID=43433 RepID=UPI002220111D|nr:uncharacterized protein BZA05DRAFT_398774 [Tricharina praecox]KAI5850818.1 hypothetical protein BZA05DRAFT_398774 [Tricharina praecox]